MDVATAQSLWKPERVYLNTASYGLPPLPALEKIEATLDDWRAGRTTWEPWGEATEAARASFARIVGVPVADVATGATVSELVGLVASSIPDGSRVMAPDIEFTSALFPFLVHEDRGVTVKTTTVAALPDAIDERTDVVVCSAVQSADGEIADLDAIVARGREAGALLVLDATQAVGWLPIDASRFDAVVCHGYKWLMSPRGTSYLYIAPSLRDRTRPLAAGWYAGEDVHETYYGPPLRLARDARRFDTSPAWFSWVGAAPALEIIEQIGIEAIYEHDVALANRFRRGLGLEPTGGAIVSLRQEDAAERLGAAGIMAATRAGHLRASFHVYNTEQDVDAAIEALTR